MNYAHFSLEKEPKIFNVRLCQNVCDALRYLLGQDLARNCIEKYRYSNGHKLCSYYCRFVLFRYESD